MNTEFSDIEHIMMEEPTVTLAPKPVSEVLDASQQKCLKQAIDAANQTNAWPLFKVYSKFCDIPEDSSMFINFKQKLAKISNGFSQECNWGWYVRCLHLIATGELDNDLK